MSSAFQTVTPSAEDELLEFCHALRRHKAGRFALHFKLSLLSPRSSGAFANRNAASFFHGLIKADKGRLFRLSNNDIGFISTNVDRFEVEKLESNVIRFFNDDSNIADDPSVLSDRFDLTSDYEVFLARCGNISANAEANVVPLAPKAATKGDVGRSFVMRAPAEEAPFPDLPQKSNVPKRLFFADEEVKPISPADLDRLESNFRILDPTNLLMDLPVAAILGDMPPHVIFSEKAIDYESLRGAVLPSRDMQADANLFERLRCIVEQQLIKKLRVEASSTALANSFPSNVKTVLSSQFIRFDRAHRRRSNVPLIIDIRLHDALMHMGQYLQMRERTRDAGYRICLSEMSPYGFATMDHSHRLADFIKVSVKGPEDIPTGPWLEHFHESAQAAGPNRLILSDCDTQEILEIGRELGFSLFQGDYVNTLIMRAAESHRLARAAG